MNELTVVGGASNDALIPVRELYSNLNRSLEFTKVLCRLNGDTPDLALAKIIYGAEMGVTPFTAMRSIHIVQGRPAVSTDLLCGLARSIGITFEITHSDPPGKWCKVKGNRGGESYEFVYTIEMASNAKLTGKDNWKNYPWDMLYARAMANVCRRLAPDRLANVYTPEEMESVKAEPQEPKRLLQRVDDTETPTPAPAPAIERDPRDVFAEMIGERGALAERVLLDRKVLKEGQTLADLHLSTVKALINGKREAFMKSLDEAEAVVPVDAEPANV